MSAGQHSSVGEIAGMAPLRTELVARVPLRTLLLASLGTPVLSGMQPISHVTLPYAVVATAQMGATDFRTIDGKAFRFNHCCHSIWMEITLDLQTPKSNNAVY